MSVCPNDPGIAVDQYAQRSPRHRTRTGPVRLLRTGFRPRFTGRRTPRPPADLGMARLVPRRRRRRPAPRRLRGAAGREPPQEPGGRTRPVRRRGRKGDPPRGRRRAPRPLPADGPPLGRAARRPPGRRRRPVYIAPTTSSNRSPASRSTAAPSPSLERPPLPAVDDAHRPLPRARRIIVCEDIVDHRTSARSSGARRRSGWTPSSSRRAARTRCTGGSVKVSMGAVFALPYARMDDWHHGLAVSGPRVSDSSRSPRTSRPSRSTRRSWGSGSRSCWARRATGSRRAGWTSPTSGCASR